MSSSSELLQLYAVNGKPIPNNYIATGYMTWGNIPNNGATSSTYLVNGWVSPNLIVSSPTPNNILVQPTTSSTQVGFQFAQSGIYELTINLAYGYASSPNINWRHYIALSTSSNSLITPGNVAGIGAYGLYTTGASSAIMYQNLSGNSNTSTPSNIDQTTINGTGNTWFSAYNFSQQYTGNVANNNTYTLKATVYASENEIIYPISQVYSGDSANAGEYVCMGTDATTPYSLPFTCKLIKLGTPF